MISHFIAAAETELYEAAEWYERQSRGLGVEFLAEVDRARELLESLPMAWPKISRNIRRCRLSRFPYGLLFHYQTGASEILIIAVMHLHRDPDYWQDRVNED